jgi:hypothetical protein
MTITSDVYTLLIHDVPVPPLDRALEMYLIQPSGGNLSPLLYAVVEHAISHGIDVHAAWDDYARDLPKDPAQLEMF